MAPSPNVSPKKSNSLLAVCAYSGPLCLCASVRYTRTLGDPATTMGSLNLPAMMVPGKLGLVQLKLYCVPPETERGLPVLPLPTTR